LTGEITPNEGLVALTDSIVRGPVEDDTLWAKQPSMDLCRLKWFPKGRQELRVTPGGTLVPSTKSYSARFTSAINLIRTSSYIDNENHNINVNSGLIVCLLAAFTILRDSRQLERPIN
jgi:hypothetical protein